VRGQAYLVHHFVERTAAAAPEREMLVEAGAQPVRRTYRDVNAAANRFARLLAAYGLGRGDRVALLAHNSSLYAEAYYGILKAGGVAVPLNTAADPGSLQHFVEDCGAEILVAGPRMEKALVAAIGKMTGLRVLVAPDPAKLVGLPAHIEGVAWGAAEEQASGDLDLPLIDRDLASIIYTSGSTGRPRGATLSHLNLVSNARSIVEYLELGPDDRVLAVLPFYYVYGKSVLNTHACAGATVVIENRFQYPNVALDTLEAERCTGFSGVPSTYTILLNRSNLGERPLAALRYVTQAGGAMSPATVRRLVELLPRQRVYVMYGATEASARLAYLPPEELGEAVGSIGRAIPNVSLAVRRPDGTEAGIDEVGELVARGSNIMLGYWRDAEETGRVLSEHGYHTGDLARRDERGLLYIVGRKKDMIKVGGHRVAAREIEDAILEHPEVHETAVIGVPDELLGEQVKAFVVLRHPGTLDADALGGFLKPRLAPYKIPALIDFRSELPKNESGKIMKEALRAESREAGA
jgi:long-chain acyl-CoA synthetase